MLNVYIVFGISIDDIRRRIRFLYGCANLNVKSVDACDKFGRNLESTFSILFRKSFGFRTSFAL